MNISTKIEPLVEFEHSVFVRGNMMQGKKGMKSLKNYKNIAKLRDFPNPHFFSRHAIYYLKDIEMSNSQFPDPVPPTKQQGFCSF